MKLRIRSGPCVCFLAAGISFIGVLKVSRVGPAADTEGPSLALNQIDMNNMMAGMVVKPTGNADHDFVAMMVPHHEGAIDMATAELQYGHNQKLLRIAQEIVVEQEQEIAAMRLAIGEPASATWVTKETGEAAAAAAADMAVAGGDVAFVRQLNAAMDKMMTDMTDMTVKPSGNVDHDFVAMMVRYHEGAIDMAQDELRYGQNAQLKTIAQEIIVDQMQELTLMRLALAERLPRSMSSPTQMRICPASPAGAH